MKKPCPISSKPILTSQPTQTWCSSSGVKLRNLHGRNGGHLKLSTWSTKRGHRKRRNRKIRSLNKAWRTCVNGRRKACGNVARMKNISTSSVRRKISGTGPGSKYVIHADLPLRSKNCDYTVSSHPHDVQSVSPLPDTPRPIIHGSAITQCSCNNRLYSHSQAIGMRYRGSFLLYEVRRSS